MATLKGTGSEIKNEAHNNTHAKRVELIEVETTIGRGDEESPFRRVRIYYDLKGNVQATYDPMEG